MNLTIIYQTQFFKNTQEQDAHYYFPGKVTLRNEIFNRQTNAIQGYFSNLRNNK